jgi:hypothetical protein
MRNLIRSPLSWMVAAELAVVGALVVVAWNVVASASHPAPMPALAQASDAPSDPGSPQPLTQLPTPPQAGPLPGLNLDSAFWRERLAQLNSDQIDLEQLEWRIVRSAEAAAQSYVETVILPAIQRAEHTAGVAVL